MNRNVTAIATAVALTMLAAPLAAQWKPHPTPGLPRTADGKPNLSAPAPRAADGKPDFSGTWRVKQSSYLFYVTQALRPEDVEPWAAAIYKQRADNFRSDTDGIKCLPPGPKAGISGGGLPVKIVQTPQLVVLLYEYQTLYRQVFLDGRSLPDDPNPTWMGYSVGRWEGDTMVVTTAGYNDKTTLDLGGHPHTEALRVTERFHRRDAGHIDLQVTLDDPKAYRRSWTLPIELELMADSELIEYVCENERDSKHLVGKRGEEFHVAPEVLASYVGTYVGRRTYVVTLDGDRLMIDQDGAGGVPLFAHSETSFTEEGTGIDFVRDGQGRVTALVQKYSEGDWPAKRTTP